MSFVKTMENAEITKSSRMIYRSEGLGKSFSEM